MDSLKLSLRREFSQVTPQGVVREAKFSCDVFGYDPPVARQPFEERRLAFIREHRHSLPCLHDLS